MKQYGLYLFDLDGTLYRGVEPIPGATHVLRQLRKRGARIGFLTNNSSRTASDVAASLASLGFEAHAEEVVTSSMIAAAMCRERGWQRAFVVGEQGLTRTLEGSGIEAVLSRAQVVVAGICRNLSYELLDHGLQELLGGATLLATNRDATLPLEQGRFAPGAGAIVAALEACSALTAIVAGKPEPAMAVMAMERAGSAPADTLIVGDRYETDILCAVRAGVDSVLLPTGVSTRPPLGTRAISGLEELI